MANFTPPGFSSLSSIKSTICTVSALSSSESTLAIMVMNPRSRSFTVRPCSLRPRSISIRCSRNENGPPAGSISGLASLSNLVNSPTVLALTYIFGSLLGKPEIARLIFGEVANLASKGTTPVQFGVGAAAIIFLMGALLGHKWAANSGASRPNVGICNGSTKSGDCPTKRKSVKRKAWPEVSVNVVNCFQNGVSLPELTQILLLAVLVVLALR